MSWHNDDDEVENDSVGWFNARDYEEDRAPEPQPQSQQGPNPWWSEPAPRRLPRFYDGRD